MYWSLLQTLTRLLIYHPDWISTYMCSKLSTYLSKYLGVQLQIAIDRFQSFTSRN